MTDKDIKEGRIFHHVNMFTGKRTGPVNPVNKLDNIRGGE